MKTNGLRKKKPAMARACARCGRRNGAIKRILRNEDGTLLVPETLYSAAMWHRAVSGRK